MKNKHVAIVRRYRRGGPGVCRLPRKPRHSAGLAEAAGVGQIGGQDRRAFVGKNLVIEELTADAFNGVDIALFSAG